MTLLSNFIKQNQIPGSMLLVGGNEEEKLLSAKSFIKKIYNNSIISNKIDRNSFLDLKILDTANNIIKIEEVRGVIKFLSLSPLESDKKFVIIVSADKMNKNAANALLKMLEEPPANSHIILIAPSVDSLLPTIRSRCILVHFTPNTDDYQNPEIDQMQAGKLQEIMIRSNISREIGQELIESYNSFIKILTHKIEQEIITFVAKISAKNGEKNWAMFKANYLYFLSIMSSRESVYFSEEELTLLNMQSLKNIDFLELYSSALSLFNDEEKVNLDRRSVVLILINKLTSK